MKSVRIKLVSFVLFVFSSLFALNSQGQTPGTFTFTINPVAHSGSYGSKHVVAIWIETASGTFVKTKLRQSGGSTVDHLGNWTAKSNSNVVDAITGATLTTYNVLTVTWDGTNITGTLMPDGDYKVWIELAWDNSKTEGVGKTTTSFAFTKGTASSHLTPANTSLFTGIILDWAPQSTTGIEDITLNSNVRVFPNPSNGLVNLDFKTLDDDATIQVVDISGRTVYNEKVPAGPSRIKTIDLSEFTNGVYLIKVQYPNKSNNLSSI